MMRVEVLDGEEYVRRIEPRYIRRESSRSPQVGEQFPALDELEEHVDVFLVLESTYPVLGTRPM